MPLTIIIAFRSEERSRKRYYGPICRVFEIYKDRISLRFLKSRQDEGVSAICKKVASRTAFIVGLSKLVSFKPPDPGPWIAFLEGNGLQHYI